MRDSPVERWLLTVVPVVLLLACGRIDYDPLFDGALGSSHDASSDTYSDAAEGFQDSEADFDAGPPAETLTVEPTYPNHAAWNDYIARTDLALDQDHQPDVGCLPLDPIDGIPCIHGGERRRVQTSRASCDGLRLEDSLGAFVWRCDASSGVAVFYSRSLARGVGLSDLLEPSGAGFRSLHVTLFDGATTVETSAPAVWWANQVKPVPLGGGALLNDSASIGDIFVAVADQTVSGFTIGDDRVALVSLDGATISFEPTTPANCASSSSGTIDARCLVLAENRSFLWIEGSFRGDGNNSTMRGILLRAVRNSRLHDIRIRNTGSFGLDIQSVFESRIENIHQQSARHGIAFANGRHNRLAHLRLGRNSEAGLWMAGGSLPASHNVIHDVRSSNNLYGLYIDCGARDDIFTEIVVNSNASEGIASPCNAFITYSHVTAIGNSWNGLRVHRGQNIAIVQTVVSRNGNGLVIESGGGRHAQIVAPDNTSSGVRIASGGGVFHGALVVGNNTSADCNVLTTNAGLVTGTCTMSGTDGSADYGAEMSTAILRTGRSVADAFRGKVDTDDSVNASDMDGFAEMVSNWTDFDSSFRLWGRDGASFVSGSCGMNCRIWDWRLATTANPLLNTSGDGATVEAPRAGAPCPVWVRGDRALTDFSRFEIIGDGAGNDDGMCDGGEACHPPNTFLINALEVMEDGEGDDDGLCESGETCIASPHFGAWQGDGEPSGVCTFDPGPGPISSVTMLVR